MEKLKAFFSDKEIESVLDVGTGSGNFIAILNKAMPDSSITGVDPSVDAMKEAVEFYPEVTFQEMTGEQLHFPANSFDVASISMALHHLPNIKKSLAEMKRVVNPGGFIIVNELFSDNLNEAQEVHKLMHHFRSKIDRLCGISHNETFTKKEILELVADSNLKILFHFENTKASKPLTSEEINERSKKIDEMQSKVEGTPEYDDLSHEAKYIHEALQKYGFAMATRIVIVAKVD